MEQLGSCGKHVEDEGACVGGGAACRTCAARRFCAELLVKRRKIPERDAARLAKLIVASAMEHPLEIDPLLKVMQTYVTERTMDAKERMYIGVQQLFSSADTLYWTFYVQILQGVDYQMLARFYTLLLAAKDRKLASWVMCKIKRLSRNLMSGKIANVPAVIFLINPLFLEIEHRKVLKCVVEAMSCLHGKARDDLVADIGSLELEHFQGLLMALHQHITITLFDEKHPETTLKYTLELMAIMYDANIVSKVVRDEEFCNTAVNGRDLDIEKDFLRWVRGNQTFSFCNYPFIYNSGSKSEILRLENNQAQGHEVEYCLQNSMHGNSMCPYLVLEVRRGEWLLSDTLDQVQAAKQFGTLKRPLKVKFIGEAGIDEGGLAKEFFQLLLQKIFAPDYGMFVYDEDTQFWWFRSLNLDLREEFELCGAILGLAIFNHHHLDLRFPTVVYKKLLGQKLEFDDLKSAFPDIHSSLQKLRGLDDLGGLGLYFEVERYSGLEGRVSVDLVTDGYKTPVTQNNREHYIKAYTEYLLETSIKKEFEAFQSGFLSICCSRSLSLFRPQDLEDVACGLQLIDIDALKASVHYQDGYVSSHRVVQWFWTTVRTYTNERCKALLSFVTGSDRVPIRGFSALQPRFTISRVGSTLDRLPSAHTCFNHLMLPDYNSLESLQEKLAIALENTEGFGLT